jgi:uncharacterized membrane protein
MDRGALESGRFGSESGVAGMRIGDRVFPRRQSGWLLLAALAFAEPSAAFADFRICNGTQARIGVAIGYKDGEAWITEGWWNLQANACETIIRGPLVARFYYLYAIDYDQGGEWSGKAFMCTRDREFTIRGLQDCLARGFNRTGFFEVDTGEQKNWTVQLTEQNQIPTTTPRASQNQTKSGMGGR